jgi:hypothetical protein
MPLFYGEVKSINGREMYGIIYNFYGYHNLEYIKEKVNTLCFQI